jgi:hypothetical protein
MFCFRAHRLTVVRLTPTHSASIFCSKPVLRTTIVTIASVSGSAESSSVSFFCASLRICAIPLLTISSASPFAAFCLAVTKYLGIAVPIGQKCKICASCISGAQCTKTAFWPNHTDESKTFLRVFYVVSAKVADGLLAAIRCFGFQPINGCLMHVFVRQESVSQWGLPT